MKHPILTAIGVFGGILLGCDFAHASLRTIPAVIDKEAFVRDEVYFTVTLVNESSRMYRVNPVVGEFDAQAGTLTISGTPYDSNRLISASIELPRDDFSIAPGASRSLTGKITVSPHMPPGTYHAVVAFADRYFEPGVGQKLENDNPRTLLNVTVRNDIRERLNLNLFRALRKVFVRFPATLSVTLHNGGNVPLTPDIEVRLFDRRDREQGVATAESVTIDKDDTVHVPVAWEGDHGFGRYHAKVDVNYGVANGGQLLTATTSFWVLPVWLLVLIGVLMIVMSYVAARFIVRTTRTHHVPH